MMMIVEVKIEEESIEKIDVKEAEATVTVMATIKAKMIRVVAMKKITWNS